jgi:hypothetical protein
MRQDLDQPGGIGAFWRKNWHLYGHVGESTEKPFFTWDRGLAWRKLGQGVHAVPSLLALT